MRPGHGAVASAAPPTHYGVMRAGARWICLCVAAAAVISGCTAGGHRGQPAPVDAGSQDRLVFEGDSTGVLGHPGVAWFDIRNVDAGPIVVSSSSRRRVRLACAASTTLRVKVGDGSGELIVRQVGGQFLLRRAIREGGRWYVLARAFGALISRDRPDAVAPASFGCAR